MLRLVAGALFVESPMLRQLLRVHAVSALYGDAVFTVDPADCGDAVGQRRCLCFML